MAFTTLFKVGASLVLGMVAALTGYAQTSAALQPGDPAPAFSLPGSDGKTYTLAQYKGESAVVLAWFPKAFTGG